MNETDPLYERRCSAMSKRTRQRCKRAPIPGGRVCSSHGGKAPQVQRSARQRIAELHDPAIRRYARALESDDDRTALRAAGDVMKFSIDHTPPAPPDPDTPPPYDYSRLSVDELELLSVLIAKLEGGTPRYDGGRLYQLTIGKTEWLLTQPGSDVRYPVMPIRLEAVPDPNARPTTGLLPVGQEDDSTDLREVPAVTDRRATDCANEGTK